MFPELRQHIKLLDITTLSDDRKIILDSFSTYLQGRIHLKKPIYLNFICTHNSRRSVLAQVWFQAVSRFYDIPLIYCFSGGTEATEIYPEIINTLQKVGFETTIPKKKKKNSRYYICYSEKKAPIVGFSKKYDHSFNPQDEFVAVMTCGHAAENCPIIPGASNRFSLTYEDPKVSDGSDLEKQTYHNRSLQVAIEAKYVFSQITT
jgi:arsenate reductase